MLSEDKYFRDLTEAELWQRYCGFLDLSIGEFMDIQNELLMDEIDRVANSALGKKIMGQRKPESVEEFRRIVPLTTYDDYEPYLSRRQEDALADKTVFWCHSSGRGGHFKWVPYTQAFLEKGLPRFIAILILACARRKGEINVRPGDRMLLHVAPRPYVSGAAMHYVVNHAFTLHTIPPLEEAEKMEFPERIAKGFQIALRTGVDEIFSIASVLVKVGEEMAGQARRVKFSLSLLHPALLFRLARAWLRSRIAKRAMLPSDLWQAKAILTIGVDTSIYKAEISHYWGRSPYEIYGGTEVFPVAIQAWNKKWLTFLPDAAFFEFIPEEEQQKSSDNPEYQPATVLLDEVEAGKNYEIIITQLRGMPLLRYRLGDFVTITALADEEAGINLPQMMFKGRTDEIITLASLAKLDERTLWQAIANTGFKYEDWTARKEYGQGQAYLHVYLEPKESGHAHELERLIDAQLKVIDPDYRDIDSWLGMQPVKVTFLSKGTFQRYFEEKRREGADFAHFKPRHINAPDEAIQRLLRLSNEGG